MIAALAQFGYSFRSRGSPQMASAMTTEFVSNARRAEALPFSLLEQEGLVSRLGHELQEAFGELSRDPQGFIRGLFFAGTKDDKRRQRIRLGLAFALAAHVALLTLIAVFGWHTVFVKQTEAAHAQDVTWVPPTAREKDPIQGDAPRGDKNAGSGGGGDHYPNPATKGPLPEMSTRRQIVQPNTPSTPLPKIPISPTIVGADGQPPPPGVALGVPTGPAAEAPSPGPGEGEGLGGVKGSGAGPGSGGGSGGGTNPGGSGGKNRIGLPNGRDDVKGPIPYNLIRNFPDSTGIVWLYRPRPVTTPEAKANKVSGEVLLRATFREDGTITDIEVIRDVPFMTESAKDALLRSRFRPATIKGRLVTVTNVIVRINVDVFERER